jgi:hypothetical protein
VCLNPLSVTKAMYGFAIAHSPNPTNCRACAQYSVNSIGLSRDTASQYTGISNCSWGEAKTVEIFIVRHNNKNESGTTRGGLALP